MENKDLDKELVGDKATKKALISEFLGGEENIRNTILDEFIDDILGEHEMLKNNEPLEQDASRKEMLEYEQEEERQRQERFEKGIK